MNPARQKRLQATLNSRAPAPTEQSLSLLAALRQNVLSTSRTELLRHLFDPRRDIDEECGYPKAVSELAYRTMFDREMGRRVVNVYPEETWKKLPIIYEDPDATKDTPFEKDLD